MITLDENNTLNEKFGKEPISEIEDVQGKVESLRNSLSNGEIPEDLREFIVSLKNDSITDASEAHVEFVGDDEVTSYEADIDESLADDDDVEFLSGDVNVTADNLF